MTKEETIEHFRIPAEILDEYHALGLCDEVKRVMGAWQYDDVDIERLGLIMTLHDIGLDRSEIGQYMQFETQGEKTEAQRQEMLAKRRSASLDEIHFREKQLDRIDYLRRKMKRG